MAIGIGVIIGAASFLLNLVFSQSISACQSALVQAFNQHACSTASLVHTLVIFGYIVAAISIIGGVIVEVGKKA